MSSSDVVRRVRSLLERAGLRVYEATRTQMMLTGGSVSVRVVVGASEDGGAKIQFSVAPGSSHMVVVYHGDSGDVARLADRLESLGGRVEVEGDRLTASFKNPDVGLVGKVALALGTRGEPVD